MENKTTGAGTDAEKTDKFYSTLDKSILKRVAEVKKIAKGSYCQGFDDAILAAVRVCSGATFSFDDAAEGKTAFRIAKSVAGVLALDVAALKPDFSPIATFESAAPVAPVAAEAVVAPELGPDEENPGYDCPPNGDVREDEE